MWNKKKATKRNRDNARTRGNRHWNVDCRYTKLKIDSTNTFCVNFVFGIVWLWHSVVVFCFSFDVRIQIVSIHRETRTCCFGP